MPDHRPRYHFLPERNWMNDPNGVIQWRGRYHLFYQHNPHGALWGNMHWGHAVSDDLVHWEHFPIALTPTEGDFDEYGCFSGCIVDNDGVPTMIYTGTQAHPTNGMPYAQHANVAIGNEELTAWRKHAGNPVIRPPDDYHNLMGFRDHCVWREGDEWLQIIGAGVNGQGGVIFLYRSDDLLTWEYLHPLCQFDAVVFDGVQVGTMWECPQLLNFGEKHALLLSVMDEKGGIGTVYLIGSYWDRRFEPERAFVLDFGRMHFYAPQALTADDGRIMLWGWITEGRDDALLVQAGWAGVMSLPRVVTLGEDDRLRFAPVQELAQLRGREFGRSNVPAIQSSTLEIYAVFKPTERIEIAVRCSERERTTIFYDPKCAKLGIERGKSVSAGSHQHDLTTLSGNYSLTDGELTLHIFVDQSVIEVFANGEATVTGRVYPHPDSLGIAVNAREEELIHFTAWELNSIW